MSRAKTETAILALGCFWCSEAIFLRLKGVLQVVPGYTGGDSANPTYDEVCDIDTGHVEAVSITFDPAIISYSTILEVFWHIHDPTTRNKQGNDVGPQYRSVIFYCSEEQKEVALRVRNEIEKAAVYTNPLVTEIVPAKTYYPAESFHRNYYQKNESIPYCSIVIDPKIEKLLAQYGTLVRDEFKEDRGSTKARNDDLAHLRI